MSTKTLIFMFSTIGSMIGGYVPLLFGVSEFSYTSLVTGSIGALIGVFIGFKIGEGI